MANDEFKEFLKEVHTALTEMATDLEAAAWNEPNETLKGAYLANAARGKELGDRFGDMIVQRSLGL